jgi:hypothetical protein
MLLPVPFVKVRTVGRPAMEAVLHQITYISTAQAELTEDSVQTILASSRRNNRREGITGLLISDGTRFLQALEGDEAAVTAAYARIKADPRHRAAVILTSKAVTERQFGFWDMAFTGFADVPTDASLSVAVDRLVSEVKDPNVRALFSSFARIDRWRAA